jgi:hypothetical protein
MADKLSILTGRSKVEPEAILKIMHDFAFHRPSYHAVLHRLFPEFSADGVA